MMRLAKFMAQAGLGSRRDCEKIIPEGKVFINGERITEVVTQVDETADEVTFRGRRLTIKRKEYFAINKPIGYTCSERDEYAEKLVHELIPEKKRLFMVGRLDKASEGLLILTNDGELAQKLTHPSFGIEKKYRVWVKGLVSQKKLDHFVREGVYWDGVLYKMKSASIKRPTNDGYIINFVLKEGKNREIRKVCQALELQVKKLKRVEIGPLKLGAMPPGAYRTLQEHEVKALLKAFKED